MRLAAAILLATLAAAPVMAQQPAPPAAAAPAPAAPPAAAAPAAPAARAPRAHHPRMTMQQRFELANTTHDGKLTLPQAKAGKMTRVAANFDAIDAQKRGYVTVEDIRAYNKAQRAAKKAAAH